MNATDLTFAENFFLVCVAVIVVLALLVLTWNVRRSVVIKPAIRNFEIKKERRTHNRRLHTAFPSRSTDRRTNKKDKK